jgi:transcriptional regulator with XRE-family HTH domain
MGHTRASRQLEKATKTAGKDGKAMTQTEIADVLGCTQGYVSRLLSGKEKPQSRAMALRIQAEFGIPPDWWDQPEAAPEQSKAG